MDPGNKDSKNTYDNHFFKDQTWIIVRKEEDSPWGSKTVPYCYTNAKQSMYAYIVL